MRVRRSMFIVPGNVPRFLEKAKDLDADVLMLDIQDAIANNDGAKAAARGSVSRAIREGGFRASEIAIRVNGPASPWFDDDIRDVISAGADSIVLSHVFSLSDVLYAEERVLAAACGRPVEIQLEADTPALIAELETIARRTTLISAVGIGTSDLALEMGAQAFGPFSRQGDDWLAYARGKIVMIGRWRGWNVTDVVGAGDPASAAEAMRRSRQLGFDGTGVLLPSLIDVANRVYGVEAPELAWAQTLLTRWAEIDETDDRDKGFRVIDGAYVFAPTYEYACRVIQYAKVLAGDPEANAAFRANGLGSPNYLMEKRIA